MLMQPYADENGLAYLYYDSRKLNYNRIEVGKYLL